MFFEGPEKKLEIQVRTPAGGDLRTLGDDFWAERVEEADATILSTLRNEAQTAYLLSESSLFVFRDRLVMITCGRTNLARAAATFLKAWGEDVALLVYERKNENFPEYQPTGFMDDARALAAYLPAEACRFGAADGHRIQMLTSIEPVPSLRSDRTLEVLMHGISPAAAKLFGRARRDADDRLEGAFRALLAGFEVDEHYFEPTGYSLNAIRGADYITVHVTPEEIASYVSFETNVDFGHLPSGWVERLREVFMPQAMDVMTFSPTPPEGFGLDGYLVAGWAESKVPCGYHVAFRHFERTRSAPDRAFPLPLV